MGTRTKRDSNVLELLPNFSRNKHQRRLAEQFMVMCAMVVEATLVKRDPNEIVRVANLANQALEALSGQRYNVVGSNSDHQAQDPQG